MVASQQMIETFDRRLLRPALLLLAGSSLVAVPSLGHAASQIVATRIAPSAVTSHYGPAVPLPSAPASGTFIIPTGTGIESRALGGGSARYGSFRTAGRIDEVASSGTTAYLFAGERGIVAVDVSDSSSLVAIGGHDHLGAIGRGAFAPGSGTLAAASDSAVYFLRELAPGSLSLIQSRVYRDGRALIRLQARNDSVLVLSRRTGGLLTMFLTLYRARSGAAPESLWEVRQNGVSPSDLAWSGDVAFIAAGNAGIIPVDVATRVAGAAVPVAGGVLARSLDADAATVVAVGEARTFARFLRSGPKGQTLIGEANGSTHLEPFHVRIVGGMAVVSEDDQSPPAEPDEMGQSVVEYWSIAGSPVAQPPAPDWGAGRVRRVAYDAGYAYLADYNAGLRVYRADPADTSLVGLLVGGVNDHVFDVALDALLHRAYLAAGSGGLQVVDITDPTSPVLVGALSLTGSTVAVAVVNDTLVVVARRGGSSAGVTFVDVTVASAPFARGEVNSPFVEDPRAIAVRDSIAFIADVFLGLQSIRFGNPDAPAVLGAPSGFGARDLDLAGDLLLVGTRSAGVEFVDVFRPESPSLLATLPTPAVFGVAQLGQTAIACLGDGGALAIDIRDWASPRVRGPIAVPGFARDAAWVGDTLLVAASFAMERFRASATVTSDPALSVTIDPGAILPRARVSWSVSAPSGAIGWNVYRDLGTAGQGVGSAIGVRVNDPLLDPSARSVDDTGLKAGTNYRYRLEAFYADGASRKVAEGTAYVPSVAGIGRLYPNPFYPNSGQSLTVPYRVFSADGGKSIRLRVYDVQGRLIRDIASTTPSAGGFGLVVWDGRDDRGRIPADGMYFAAVEGPGIDDSRQLLLLR